MCRWCIWLWQRMNEWMRDDINIFTASEEKSNLPSTKGFFRTSLMWQVLQIFIWPEQKTLELLISRSMLDLLFLLISRLLKFVLTKVYITLPIEWRLEKPEQPIRKSVKRENLKFCAPFNEWTLIGQTKYEYLKREKKSGLRRKLKVFTFDVQIKQFKNLRYPIFKFQPEIGTFLLWISEISFEDLLLDFIHLWYQLVVVPCRDD